MSAWDFSLRTCCCSNDEPHREHSTHSDFRRGGSGAIGRAGCDGLAAAADAKFEAGNNSVYAVLKQGTDGFAQIDHLTTEALRTNDAVPVESVWWYNGKQQVRFPFNKFWVAEANAAAAEHAYVENNRRDNQNAYVTVRVRRGDAALDQLYIDGQPLADYLRAHSAR